MLSSQPDDESIVVGMTNGILNIKHRKTPGESKEASGQQRRRPSYRVFMKRKNFVPKQASSQTHDVHSSNLLFPKLLTGGVFNQ